jgi:hypothetical protein
VAVMSIILTAPVGAWAIAWAGRNLLTVSPESGFSSSYAAVESDAAFEPLAD